MLIAEDVPAEVHAFLNGQAEGLRPEDAVKRLDKALDGDLRKRLSMNLIEAGVLRVQEGGLLPSTKYPVADLAVHAEVLGSAEAAARAAESLTDRQAVLPALAGPCRLLERVAPERSGHKHAKARIAEVSEQAPFASEVEKVIDRLIAAESGL